MKYTVEEISAKDARAIICKYHYSGKSVNNAKIHLGVFDGNVLVGCLQYGPPINGSITARKISDAEPMMELNRMVMADSEGRNAETQALAACHKWLRRNTNLQWILSFSDGKEGNVGYIYQANNWKYLGYMVSDSFYDLDGEYVHNITVWHRYKEKHPLRDKYTTDEIVGMNFNNVSKISAKQYVYVFPLGKVDFKFESKPYPKLDTEPTILKRRWLYRDSKEHKVTELLYNGTLEPIF